MENIAIRQVSPNGAKKSILRAFKKKRPLFMWGPPGIGKSETFEQIKQAYIEQGKTCALIDCRFELKSALRGYNLA